MPFINSVEDFIAAIKEKEPIPEISVFSPTILELTGAQGTLLADTLANARINSPENIVTISSARLCDRATQAICDGLSRNTRINTLAMSYININEVGHVLLLKTVEAHPSITDLDISFNDTPECLAALRSLIANNSNLKKLALHCDLIDDNLITAIYNGLRSNKTLASIRLFGTYVVTQGGSLRMIQVFSNNIFLTQFELTVAVHPPFMELYSNNVGFLRDFLERNKAIAHHSRGKSYLHKQLMTKSISTQSGITNLDFFDVSTLIHELSELKISVDYFNRAKAPVNNPLRKNAENDFLLYSLRFFLRCSHFDSDNFTSFSKPEFFAALQAFSMIEKDSRQYLQACYEMGQQLLRMHTPNCDPRILPMTLQCFNLCRLAPGFVEDGAENTAQSSVHSMMRMSAARLEQQSSTQINLQGLDTPMTDEEYSQLNVTENYLPGKTEFNSETILKCINDLKVEALKTAQHYRDLVGTEQENHLATPTNSNF